MLLLAAFLSSTNVPHKTLQTRSNRSKTNVKTWTVDTDVIEDTQYEVKASATRNPTIADTLSTPQARVRKTLCTRPMGPYKKQEKSAAIPGITTTWPKNTASWKLVGPGVG